jgi:hypothetical protein
MHTSYYTVHVSMYHTHCWLPPMFIKHTTRPPAREPHVHARRGVSGRTHEPPPRGGGTLPNPQLSPLTPASYIGDVSLNRGRVCLKVSPRFRQGLLNQQYYPPTALSGPASLQRSETEVLTPITRNGVRPSHSTCLRPPISDGSSSGTCESPFVIMRASNPQLPRMLRCTNS